MKCKLVFSGLCAALIPLVLVSVAAAQVVTLEDFEGPLPGFQSYPGGYNFFGDGDPNSDVVVTEQITDQEAFGGVQSFQVDIDSSALTTYFYYGMGGFLGFFGENFGAAAGQPGADNPARFEMSFDLKVRGNNGDTDASTPIGGAVGLYKGDYEKVYGDTNGDGDPNDGFDIWSSTFTATVDPNNADWTHIVWNLAEGTTPTAPDPNNVPIPLFDDESTFYFQIYCNSGGFGLDPNNSFYIDNVQLEFFPAAPGDFNGDGRVDGLDFLAVQRDPSLGPLSDWTANYGTPLSGAVHAVPEPSAILTLLAGWLALTTQVRRRVAARW